MPPSTLFQQTLQILPSRPQQRFTIDPLEFAQAEPSHAMPVLAFGKEGFHPHTALAQSFLVGFGRLIGPHPLQGLLIHTAAERASLLAGRTLGFEGAVVAVFGAGAIAA